MTTGHVTLTYRNLDDALRFVEQGDHDDETVAVDHPEFYCTKRGDGAYRAPLPRLSDREFVSAHDIEDALIAAIDAGGETSDEDESENVYEAIGPDDEEAFEEALDSAVDAAYDDEYQEAWRARIESDATHLANGTVRPDVLDEVEVMEVSRGIRATKDLSADEARVVGSRKAVTAEWGGLLRTRDKHWVKPNNSWKETSVAPTQHLRHAARHPGA